MPTTYTLKPHIDNPFDNLSASVMMERSTQFRWLLTYEILGNTQAIVFPDRATSGRGAKLWEETCLELFIRNVDDQYVEFNFSPSGQWACFYFDRYRTGMRDVILGADPTISVTVAPQLFRLEVSLDLTGVGLFSRPDAKLLIGLTSVMKMQDQRYCYYALDFPSGSPDFHHPAGFFGV
ncbi:MAG: DOMON-like domain-containing protein [Burkholderiales bacterium]|jgi:hypothetical protein|nr:DOMON-like domain-containing protein [Pseudomonadota bacterium]|tara:strand:+ start:476 stop:1012 length:537 start_codon:yes stop_codon:yes gene_type:complete